MHFAGVKSYLPKVTNIPRIWKVSFGYWLKQNFYFNSISKTYFEMGTGLDTFMFNILYNSHNFSK